MADTLWNATPSSEGRYIRVWEPDPNGEPLPQPKFPGQDLSIVYFNDGHNRLFEEREGGKSFVARLDATRQGIPNQSLLLGSGNDHSDGEEWDVLMNEAETPDPAYQLFQWANVDAYTPGCEDFAWGIDHCIAKMELAPDLRFVVTNAIENTPLADATKRALVFEFKDKLVGVIGLANWKSMRSDGKSMLEPAENVGPEWLDYLSRTTNFIIVISRLGYDQQSNHFNDLQLLPMLPPRALLCGGHSHQVIPKPGPIAQGNYLQCGKKFEYFGIGYWKSKTDAMHTQNRIMQDIGFGKRIAYNDFELKQLLKKQIASYGDVTATAAALSREGTNVEPYYKESPHLNWACDRLLKFGVMQSLEATDHALLSGLCPQILGADPLSGKTNIAQWYRTFPGADSIARLSFDWNALPMLLQANAKRLLMPPKQTDERCWLHFDRQLRVEIEISGNDVEVTGIEYKGEPFETDRFLTIDLFTTASVCEGKYGFDTVFFEAGISSQDYNLRRFDMILRDWLWKRASDENALDDDPIDGRLTIERN